MHSRKEWSEKAAELRHALHQNAELSMEEKRTMELLKAFIRENSELEIVDQGKWFYAWYHCPEEEKTETIAFRADMDALPMEDSEELPYHSLTKGIAHKCGHDGHSAVLAVFACMISEEGADKNIAFIFQPGEEIGAGAMICAPIIRERKIGKIYAFHNWSGFPKDAVICRSGLIHCPSMGVTYSFTGETAHASQPEDGRSPAGAVAEFVLGFKEAIRPFTDDLSFATLVGVRVGNSDFGIAPGEGEVSLTLRSSSEKTMYAMEEALYDLALSLGKKEDLSICREYSDVFPETVNDEALVQEVITAAQKEKIESICLRDPIRSSEDYGYFQKECPGVIFYIGNGEEYPQIHTREFDFNDAIMETALTMFHALVNGGK